MKNFERREFLKLSAAAAALAAAGCATTTKSRGRVVVIGAGFGGATAAKYLRLWDPAIEVTLVERDSGFVSCPISNLVLAGFTGMSATNRRFRPPASYWRPVGPDEA